MKRGLQHIGDIGQKAFITLCEVVDNSIGEAWLVTATP